MDAFATESTSSLRAPRFWSRFAERGAESIYALCVSDWACSHCPTCGANHREVGYAFLPDTLVQASVEKAHADRGLCILVVLVTVGILHPHWNSLLAALVLPIHSPYLDGFARIRDPARSV